MLALVKINRNLYVTLCMSRSFYTFYDSFRTVIADEIDSSTRVNILLGLCIRQLLCGIRRHV